MMNRTFSHAGRRLEVRALPTIGSFLLSVWEGGKKVNQGEITADQTEMMTTEDADACMQWVVDGVIAGRIPLQP